MTTGEDNARYRIIRTSTSLGGYSASEVGRFLSISRVNAGRGAARGQKVLDKYEDLKDIDN